MTWVGHEKNEEHLCIVFLHLKSFSKIKLFHYIKHSHLFQSQISYCLILDKLQTNNQTYLSFLQTWEECTQYFRVDEERGLSPGQVKHLLSSYFLIFPYFSLSHIHLSPCPGGGVQEEVRPQRWVHQQYLMSMLMEWWVTHMPATLIQPDLVPLKG